jgi:hypothetical protein
MSLRWPTSGFAGRNRGVIVGEFVEQIEAIRAVAAGVDSP